MSEDVPAGMTGMDMIRKLVDQAQPFVPEPEPPPEPPPGGTPPPPQDGDPGGPDPRGGGRDPDEEADDLPPGCPVTPLGVNGDRLWFLDAIGQLRPLAFSQLGQAGIKYLFGDQNQKLYDYWPRITKIGELEKVTGWKPEKAQDTLMAAAAARGIFKAEGRVRGAGCWTDEDGRLVVHLGDRLLVEGEQRPPRPIGRMVYPAGDAMPRPAPHYVKAKPAEDLLSLLRAWRWQRPDLDPDLLLGWIAAGFVAGALDYRPLAWITGDKGEGKSSLQALVAALYGPWLLTSVDPSAAGIWQSLKYDARPVALDELESDADDRKQQQVIKLARVAVTGGVILRGGDGHEGVQFTARATFLFSSILIPPLTGADQSRMAILNLQRIPAGAAEPKVQPKLWREWGEAIFRRMIDGWPRWAETLALYRQAMAKAGHNGRGADQWGTLLAARDLALYDEVPDSDTLSIWQERLTRNVLAEAAEDVADSQQCLWHLLSSQTDAHRGSVRRLVGGWIELAAKGEDPDAPGVLGACGLRVDWDGGKRWLSIANQHQGLAALFAGTRWHSGVWKQAFGRIEGAKAMACLRFGGAPSRAIRVPLDPVLEQGLRAE